MDTFNVSKRCISTYEQFLKDRKKAQDAKHDEKGESDIVKKSMSGEIAGKKGYEVLDEKLNEMYGQLVNKQVLDDYLKLEYEIDQNDIITQTYNDIKAAITGVLRKHGFAQYKSEVEELMEKISNDTEADDSFDMIISDTKDLKHLPTSQRKERLKMIKILIDELLYY